MAPRFLADEGFRRSIVTGVLRRGHRIDIIRVQDAGLSGADDDRVLEWASAEDRIVLTHDVSTMPGSEYARLCQASPMPRVCVVSWHLAIGVAIDDIVVIAECSAADEWSGQVFYLPL